MIQTINFHAFQQAFQDCNRSENFSYEGLRVLFDHIEEYEQETGEEIELDVIALCCEYYEDTTENIAESFMVDIEGMDEEEADEEVREYLDKNTLVLAVCTGRFVYQAF